MQFVKESILPATVEEVFAFHERPDAFALLQPPWDRVEILTPPHSLDVGTRVELRTKVGPAWIRIVAEHVAYERNRRFEDVMREGPFARLGRLVDPIAVRPRLVRLFDYRHEVTRREVLRKTGTSTEEGPKR